MWRRWLFNEIIFSSSRVRASRSWSWVVDPSANLTGKCQDNDLLHQKVVRRIRAQLRPAWENKTSTAWWGKKPKKPKGSHERTPCNASAMFLELRLDRKVLIIVIMLSTREFHASWLEFARESCNQNGRAKFVDRASFDGYTFGAMWLIEIITGERGSIMVVKMGKIRVLEGLD